MNSVYRTYFFLAFLVLLFSCNIEKRQYRSGYYVSTPRSVKNNIPERTHADLTSNSRIGEESEIPVYSAEEKITGTSGLPLSYTYSSEQRVPCLIKNTKNTSVKEGNFKKQNQKQSAFKPVSSDDEKAKKDVKDLLLSSIAAFFLSLLYGFFSIAGIQSLTNIIFILAPFSIIGIWIFALLLYPKYSSQEQPNSGESKPNEERIITKKKAFLLAGFLGIFGAHRFYLGYTKMGILEMFTLGGFFILYFIDFIRIKSGKLKPQKGDYDPEGINYNKAKKNKILNKSQKLIKLAMLISMIALMIILGFAIFF